jgi:hypothetical protein
VSTRRGIFIRQNPTTSVSFKPIQVECVMTETDSTRGFGGHQNDIRYSAGVVLRFGGK